MAAAAASDIPMQIAETIQTAHINRAPSAAHDLNPSTAADTREPVRLHDDDNKARGLADLIEFGHDESNDEEHIHTSSLRPQRRFSNLPPIPDLRFEQSYLHSIQHAKSWWMIAWITTKDHLLMPMIQGLVYNLALCGWQFWNKNAQLSGNSLGARARRWWYGVNNWPINQKVFGNSTAKKSMGAKDWYQR
ncbi:hypothetical protein BD289DRAFT_427178 [Coniella lustricola]|uniref:DUF1770-domain-containing protein n=1 Tax=Coniella lustricola TaxID=2025994 RepID=A0A2T3AFR4_9PEZI|nr:hypothetical protein BD289DRAFT_427178 [Coniella lustricola]